MRVGIGYDIHKLVKKRPLIIGGVKIPFNKGLDGHSDADVLTHSIIDAILGASSLGDIGTIFGVDRPEYKNISSLILLKKTVLMISKKKLSINNVDSTIIAQAPVFKDFIKEIKKTLTKILNIKLSQINVKATTAKGLGSIGKKQAIATLTIASLK